MTKKSKEPSLARFSNTIRLAVLITFFLAIYPEDTFSQIQTIPLGSAPQDSSNSVLSADDPIFQNRFFGDKFPKLESKSTGQWWKIKKRPLTIQRDQVIAFAVYTHDRSVLKLTAQLYPLKPGETKIVRVEFKKDGKWTEVARKEIVTLGWSAHFRFENWDNSQDVPYRIRHGEKASFEGLVRKDPIDKEEIVVGSLSCNSSRTPGARPQIVENLKQQNPDLLFFAGDQSYHHTQHTFGWIEFGIQFRDVLKDRPVITIPDDHDVGQANIWGESGKQAATPQGPGGGYFYPSKYVNMVQRCQTWHLPDPVDPKSIGKDIGVYFTRLRVGGIDFAILEDRKFKSGPKGKIPKLGPRPDHINDPKYDRSSVDLPELKLLGDRQIKFLKEWNTDWEGAEMKAVLSQTAFCGAVHLHGNPNNRLLADLDSNAWPQTGRNNALKEIRKSWAPHICGDQHLAVVVQHGIENPSDGPFAFTSPAIVNTIYGRWWHPANENPGAKPVANSPLPWTGQYLDGLGNRIRMLAYANPPNRKDEKQRGDGHGIVRFNKKTRTTTFECWPRFSDASKGDNHQFPGWPIKFNMSDNDGRKIVGFLPEITCNDSVHPVVQVTNEKTGEVLYTIRAKTNRFRPPVYSDGPFSVSIGIDRPDKTKLIHLKPTNTARTIKINL